MRVIAGELSGRRFDAPPGQGTRPMLDRVREAIFQTLFPWLDGARVLDLFAGSGALSIEALSRGAQSARLVERDAAVRKLCAANLEQLGIATRCELVGGDALAPSARGNGPYDVIFCDPPFPFLAQSDTRAAVLGAVAALLGEPLAPEGVLVLHVPLHALNERDFPNGSEHRERTYGGQSIWYVQAGG